MFRRPHRAFPLLLLALAAGPLACGKAPSAQDAIEVRVLDEHGRPASWARVLLRRSAGDMGTMRPRWDESTATLTLPAAGAPHALHLAARGRRTTVVEDIRASRIVRLELGYPLEIHVTGDAEAPELPRAILFRLRPVTQADPATDDEAALRVTDVCSFILPRHGGDAGSMPLLPTRRWGFAAGVVDAAKGLLLPEPGPYEIQWGLFDMDEGTWQGAPGAAHVIEVVDQGRTAQRVDVRIDASTMQGVRRALRAQIEALRRGDAERTAGPTDPADDPADVPGEDEGEDQGDEGK